MTISMLALIAMTSDSRWPSTIFGMADRFTNDGGRMRQRTGLEVRVEIEGEPRVTQPPVRIALFRVAQEALTNVVKHSGATQAQVSLNFGDEEVRLQVCDNGHGFEAGQGQPASAATRPAWGLLGMRERAELLGGRFALETEPGKGTRVCVILPYESLEAGP